MRILIIEDEYPLADAISETLKKENFNVDIVTDGIDGENEALTGIYDLILLDIMLPGKDGFEILQSIKREKIKTPIIMLTAKSQMNDKLQGLENGADDYITKPFNPLELIARVNSQIRRYTHLGSIADKQQEGNNYWSGDLVINDDTKQVTVEGKEVKLTPTEYNILKFLTKNKGIVYSIEQIYQNVWADECYGAENIIAVHIRHIREKIEINPKEPRYLKVIWGIGYKIENLEK